MANKTDLVNAVKESETVSEAGLKLNKKQTEAVVNSVFEEVVNLMEQDGKLQLIGFGSFETRERSARKGRNPQTGEEIEIPASKVPAFKPSKALKDRIKG